MNKKQSLFGKTLDELKKICENLSLPSFTSKQIADWLYKKEISSIDEMTNLSLNAREKLKENYDFGLTPYVDFMLSKDGTKKYLYEYEDNSFVEAVMIPDKERYTLCVSTQVGCKMNCQFCATARQGFKRNLSTNEILNIIRSIDEYSLLTNIVYMGMGEPLDNYENVLKSIETLTSSWAMAMSPKRITVSTCGFLPHLKDFLDSTQVHIAISLHNMIPNERQEIMPIEKAYKIKDVIELLKQYDWTGQRRLTFEYIVFKNLNDDYRHIFSLVSNLSDIECRINLIRFHTIPNTIFQQADDKDMIKIRDILTSKGLIATIRASRGEDILAACGLLSTKKLLSLPTKTKK